MTGQAHWMLLLPLILTAVGLGLMWWRDAYQNGKVHGEVRSFRCPVLLRRVTATLVREVATKEVLGVSRCGVFADPERVACQRACVELFRKPTLPLA